MAGVGAKSGVVTEGEAMATGNEDSGVLGRPLHGVNLSGWLVLETWVTPSLFAGSGAFDEPSLANSMEASRFRELLVAHREEFVTEVDFTRIAARGFDAVRLPVPWFVFGAAGPMAGPSEGCIDYVDRAFDWAQAAGIDVLLDVAVAPGADPSDPTTFFGDVETFRTVMLDVTAGLCSRYAMRRNFLGIAPVDQVVGQHRRGLSVVPGVALHSLRNFYRDAYDVVRATAGPQPVVVLHDACLPGSWRGFMAPSRYENVWLDVHPYHYAEPMGASGPTGVRKLIAATDRSLSAAGRSGLPVVVGEWSAALPLADAGMTPEGRIALERVYTAGQLGAFAKTAGWFFQTWKTEGRLSSWDARVALSSFEKGMFD